MFYLRDRLIMLCAIACLHACYEVNERITEFQPVLTVNSAESEPVQVPR